MLAAGPPDGGTPDETRRTRNAKTTHRRCAMAWILLVVSGLFETVWAAALSRSNGFSRLVPSVVFGVALLVSMGGLALALRQLPVGTAYAVWVGIGAVGTAVYGMVALGEPATTARMLCLLAIVGGVAGLKLLP